MTDGWSSAKREPAFGPRVTTSMPTPAVELVELDLDLLGGPSMGTADWNVMVVVLVVGAIENGCRTTSRSSTDVGFSCPQLWAVASSGMRYPSTSAR